MMSSVTAFAGVDVGSLGTKAVILVDGEIAGSTIIRTGINTEENGNKGLDEALAKAGLKREDLKYVVATGYGRISAPYANKTVTEITCHAKGAHYIHPQTKTIIDMGGQDCKAIRLDEDGNVVDFAMNDKCAAGTGRFLEIMANVFKVPLEELGPLSLNATTVLPVSSTCTVFAESETVSLLARGEKPENIIVGIHHAIANRVGGMFSRVGIQNDVFFSGGVAKNIGMKKALEEALNVQIVEPGQDPQLAGAIGAAVIAENLWKRGK
ncbi:CoA-substrate-specific enzyme activase [Syntrophobotulus glycolicus DSM 8271]|uniref:CoA-substrate-specific enzyme activase n=1 Tax=Syntrophobotulus glycolicus (strain DSM 8271 / FlGlyR) TaxID=645991 RepID=F0STR1_SYNGF|nr:acyl-CoA dehydratase activase [Syntrophobotulus glycolicus]ADY55351.1 CoA-substrate-specific enzyme activase [Syntrophobotulus glycolicus DSM 8271]